MNNIKLLINGSEYVGAFGCANDKYAFTGFLPEKTKKAIEEILDVNVIEFSVNSSNLTGLFCTVNSNGLGISNLISKNELKSLNKKIEEEKIDINVGILDTDLNSIGNNILLNDKFALVHTEYNNAVIKQIQDLFNVEVIKISIGNFKTVGATNILTNKGFVINNRALDREKEHIDKILNFNSIPTTANNGSLFIGLSTIANSNNLIIGDKTTGFELTRIIDALNLD
ncbi:MAG: translation initiation factor IF-6 [Candidatus Marsarchaeota archaeon]|nr:translation initiation factor IF-6 [Candidatus Marsarchaeota archaeon]MCL5094360.1 translation initiation factor IF-6 [Candidatus Marsarchaeota archaeon]